ncbi:MAG: hydroxymethylglutaryl-CoA lyase [Christensenellales bacterium]|jgi:hydroxymethylglutaryl-CoA lyase
MTFRALPKVKVVEVGPRDGFQSVQTFIPTKTKLEIIDRIVESGFSKIQATSFVSPKAIAQMQDAKIIIETVVQKHKHVEWFALVPNFHGAKSAVEAGLAEIATVVSLSESHNQANIRRSHQQSLEEIARIRETFPNVKITQDIATAFGCPFEGPMAIQPLIELIRSLHKIGIDAFTLCDTIGIANPNQVKNVLSSVQAAFPDCVFSLHIHDTRNMGILNSYIGLMSGAASVQTAVGGLGGCPFAPGASGNTSSEDLVYLLEQAGYETGINFEKLLETAKYLRSNVQGNYSGHHINITDKPCTLQ